MRAAGLALFLVKEDGFTDKGLVSVFSCLESQFGAQRSSNTKEKCTSQELCEVIFGMFAGFENFDADLCTLCESFFVQQHQLDKHTGDSQKTKLPDQRYLRLGLPACRFLIQHMNPVLEDVLETSLSLIHI